VFFDAWSWFDRTVIDGAVNGVGFVSRVVGGGVRRIQTGYVRSYALSVLFGAVLVLAAMLAVNLG
jgi:NADH-quinone oxidoreductase subunit L